MTGDFVKLPRRRRRLLTLCALGILFSGEAPMRKSKKSRSQLLVELRSAYEGGASIRKLVASTGRSYGSVHSMLRESGTTMRSRGGPNHRTRHR